MESVLISIIVPVYNVEKYIDQCVQSIQNQTYNNLEIILIDDGSTDQSGVICDYYANQDERIHVIHQKNGGLSDARNTGLGIACGDFIGFVDSDDWIEPQMYEEMLKKALEVNAEIVQCRYKSVFEDRTIDKSGNDVVILSREELLNIYICEHSQYVIQNSVWCKLFKKGIIGTLLFPKGRNSEDIMFTTKVFCKIEKCVYIDRAYYNYRINREGSIMNEKNGSRMIRDEIPFLKEQIDYLRQCGYSELAEQAEYSFYRRMLYYYIDMKMNRRNHTYADQIIAMLRSEKDYIEKIYRKPCVKKGDRYRIKLFLKTPHLYEKIDSMYKNLVVPIKRSMRRNHVL